jgi:N-acetylglucosamine malate deacetylase 1
MRLDFADERVLAVVAHPDDAELLCAGTLARADADGAAIAICAMCQGDKGQPSKTVKNLGAVRRREMKAAACLIGATSYAGNFSDGTLVDTPTARTKLIEIYRRFRPTLVLAHSPIDYHADHRAASLLAEAATWFCASRGHKTRTSPMETSPSLWWMDTVSMTGFEPGFFVDVSDFAELKEQMLLCHKSQLSREDDQDFTPLMDLLRSQQQTRGGQAGVAAAEAFQTHIALKRARAW